MKSREVPRWSGQTEIESSELPIDSLNTQQTITPHNSISHDMANKVFMTPFEVVESEPKVNEPATVKAADNAANLVQTPTCPRCNGEMVERTAKKGARQGQSFYGCAQFPKCRGVVNID